MAQITISDLDTSLELDREALNSVVGGKRRCGLRHHKRRRHNSHHHYKRKVNKEPIATEYTFYGRYLPVL